MAIVCARTCGKLLLGRNCIAEGVLPHVNAAFFKIGILLCEMVDG